MNNQFLIFLVAGCVVCVKSDVFIKNNSFVQFLEFVLKQSYNSKCFDDIRIILNSWNVPELWALKFIEATGNFPKDRYEFDDVFEIGDFDHCVHSNIHKNATTIQGKHCTTNIGLPHFLVDSRKMPKLRDSQKLNYIWGICIPKSCSVEDINPWFKNLTHELIPKNMAIQFTEDNCRTDDTYQLLTPDIIVISTFGFLILTVLASTFYEAIITKYKTDRVFTSLTTFSLLTNCKSLFKIERVVRRGTTYYSLYGIRVISIIIIIYYHLTSLLGFFPHLDYSLKLDSWTMIPYIAGTLPVDVFFVMSGLLCMHQILRRYKNGFSLKDIPNYILLRYFRYTPMILACIGVSLTYGNYVKLKTISSVDHIVDPCQNHLWENLLFVQNYLWPYTHPAEIPCVIHSWYVAAEFQLYLLSLVMLFLIQRIKRIAYLLLIILTILPSVFVILAASKYHIIEVAQAHNYTSFLLQQSNIYYFTHERAGPYFIGMILGYYMYQNKGTRPDLKKITIVLCWILTIVTIFGIVFLHLYFAQEWHEYNSFTDPTFEGLHRTVFSLGIALLIFLCENDYGGIIDKILSFKYWQPLGKLTYGVYLFHFIYIFSYYKQHNGPIKYSQFLNFNSIICVYIVSVLISVPFYLCVELPFCKIGKRLFEKM